MFQLIILSIIAAADPPIVEIGAGQTVTAEVKSFLLPEAKYDSCLANTRKLGICRDAMVECGTRASIGLDDAASGLDACLAMAADDGERIDELITNLAREHELVARYRGQRNVAIASAIGAVVVAGVAVVSDWRD